MCYICTEWAKRPCIANSHGHTALRDENSADIADEAGDFVNHVLGIGLAPLPAGKLVADFVGDGVISLVSRS